MSPYSCVISEKKQVYNRYTKQRFLLRKKRSMKRSETIFYEVHNGLYVNLTNKCSCACTFCIRNSSNQVGNANTLWLDHDPSFKEAKEALDAINLDLYEEIVFCGYGEPTEALDVLLKLAKEIKRRSAIPIRINTNGHGSLINKRNIIPELEGLIDAVSISLNAPAAEKYYELTRSNFGKESFDAVIVFAKEVKKYIPSVTLTTVSTTLTSEEEKACKRLCEELGVTYRIRAWV